VASQEAVQEGHASFRARLREDGAWQAVDLDDQEPATRRPPGGPGAESARQAINRRLHTEDEALDGREHAVATYSMSRAG
jgi:hypothetical protein